ncbi:MAG: radical SAM protein [Anaerolineae bacterium]
MDSLDKLADVATHMNLEPTGEPTLIQPKLGFDQTVTACGAVIKKDPIHSPLGRSIGELGISKAAVAGGKTIPLLKTMMTTACERNCFYCPFRAGRSSMRRQTFKPEEMAKAFMQVHKAGKAKGLFLSSGIIKGSVTTQDKIIETADILRNKYRFRGYIHLKVMPGVEKDQIRRSMELASRLSVNLEAPNDKRLHMLAPKKEFVRELVRPLQWMDEIRKNELAHNSWNGRWASSVTQFVVGAVGESDLELLSTSERMIKMYKLQRVYYSAFSPIRDTPFEELTAENPMRQHRLYQSSFLFRDYGYDLEEMPFDQQGNLPLGEDPKMAWAKRNLRENPAEINTADRQALLRIPGVGPKGADKILQARRRGTISEVRHLQQLGVVTRRMEPYVLLNGRRPERQLRLF